MPPALQNPFTLWLLHREKSIDAAYDLTDEWQTCMVDLFVESVRQQNALPTVGITGAAEVKSASLKLVEPVNPCE